MADFGFLSDTDESAVEELISQAQELSVLEQVSAINCSGFTDSVLPTELESRFRKLKSFPLTKPTTKKHLYHSKSEFSHSVKPKTEKTESDDESSEIFSPSKHDPDGKFGFERNSRSGYGFDSENKQNPEGKFGSKEKSKHGSVSVSSPSSSSNSSMENVIFSASKQNPREKKKSKSKSISKTGSFSSPLDSPSPPKKKSGCFWCSSIRVSKKKSKENIVLDTDFDWGKDDEFLSDLSTFSVKEQQKKLKKAMKEQQKISQEAEEIVKWAKQASARMTVHGIEDELSDAESTK